MRTLPLPALLLLAACSTSTGGELVEPDVQIAGAGPVQDVSIGAWSLSLDRADLAVGPLYLWSEVPASADEDAGGKLVGEAPDQVVLDVLSQESLALSDARGLGGPVGSIEVWLEPLEGGDTLVVEGTASKEGQDYPFEATISWEEPWVPEDESVNALLRRRLRGLEAQGTLGSDTSIRLTVDASAWFTEEGLDGLPDLAEGEDGVRVLTPDSLTGRDLDQGVRRVTGPAWSATVEGS